MSPVLEKMGRRGTLSQAPQQLFGLTAMVSALLGTIILVIGLILTVLLTTTLSLRTTIDETSDAVNLLLSSSRAERSLVDIETGIRGAMVTGDRAQLEPYYEGVASLPEEQERLIEFAPPDLIDDVQALDREIDAYVDDFAQPLSARIAVLELANAREKVREGKVRLDQIRSDFRDLNSIQEDRVAANRQKRSDTVDRSVTISLVGLVVSLALLIFLGWYLRRRVLKPIGGVAGAASELSEGRLGTRVPETGRGAIVALARSFNQMAAALQYRDRKLIDANRKLEGSIEQVEQASELKSAFLANMSHEIRTPLNGVMGMNALLERTELDAEQREYVRTAQASGEALMSVINDILDFSKIEAGQLDFEFHNFDLPQALDTACDVVAENAHRKGLRLHSFTDPTVPREVNGDRSRFLQVLINLLSNAIKFTEQGEVVMSATLGPEVDIGYMVLIEVRDTGIGIEPETRKRLFQAFTQADASTTREFGGTGLGLAISAQLTELMGGRITVDSIPGEGSTFTVYIPFGKPRSGREHSPQVVELRGLRVLIADGDPTGRGILDTYTSSWGMRAKTVPDAAGALRQLKKAAKRGEPFDVALIDAELNASGSPSLEEQIGGSPALRSTRVVLLAQGRSDAAELQVEQSLEVVARPLSQSRLLDAIASTMNLDPNNDSRPDREVVPADPKEARILMAEDNEINRFFLGEVLASRGFEYEVAENGRQALEMIEASPGSFDLVLMDCQMPELDGYDATRQLRRLEQADGLTRLPVIAMTAHVMEGDREKCLAAGMDDYIGKPLDVEELEKKIDQWLSHRSGS